MQAQQHETEYRYLTDAGKVARFMEEVEREKSRATPQRLASSLLIAVRHFTHPFAYHLAPQFMRVAAEACGDTLDADGFWPPCRGETWEEDVSFREAGKKRLRALGWEVLEDGRWRNPATRRFYDVDLACICAFATATPAPAEVS